MCKNQPPIAICACGAQFAACDNVEALCHITSASGRAHHWIYIYTGVYQAGTIINPSSPNPTNFKVYLAAKGRK